LEASIVNSIFKEYDIRGKIGKELNRETAYELGRLFAKKSIIIAKDSRSSSIELLEAFKQGLLDSGSDIIELKDVSSSPLLYFSHLELQTIGAVMITGSHNPLEYNGFKFMLNGEPLYGEDLKKILNNKTSDGTGRSIIADSHPFYVQSLLKAIKITKNFKIAWECNNGGVSSVLPQLNLPGEHLFLNISTDGNFANSPPDPMLDSTLKGIKKSVLDNSCDLGFAFDGDADRLVLIKANGESLTSDQLIYLLALSLKHEKNKKIILDVKSSQILIDTLEEEGFKIILAPGGHSLMKEMIVQEKAILAGEASGHYIINDKKYYALDDALYIALRLIEYLQNNPIKELPLAEFRKEIKISVQHDSKSSIINKIQESSDGLKTLGGVRKTYSDGWWLVRASNTEDYILVKYEANNKSRLEAIEKELKEIIL
jgi:phosphomannomutase